MSVDDMDDFLEHYGVKGMRWGVVKKEDSAGSLKDRISKRQTSIKEQKAKEFVEKSSATKMRISDLQKEISATPPHSSKMYDLKGELNEQQINQKRYDAKAVKTKESRLTPTQKKVLIGAAVVGGALAVGYIAHDPEKIGSVMRSVTSKAKYGDVFNPNGKFGGKISAAQAASLSESINPNYKQMGGKMNCRRCTFAYELQRRGYDVHATTSAIGRGQSESGLINALIRGDRDRIRAKSLSSSIKKSGSARTALSGDKRLYNAATETIKRGFSETEDSKALVSALKKHGVGARGEVVFNEGNFGHSMSWEVFKSGVKIFDNQKGISYDVDDQMISKLARKWGRPLAMDITRLDNVDLDLEFLSRWAANN